MVDDADEQSEYDEVADGTSVYRKAFMQTTSKK
jgi:hypothetical protein